MKQFRTQADDLKDQIKELEFIYNSLSKSLKYQYSFYKKDSLLIGKIKGEKYNIEKEIMELKSILWNIQ